MNDPAYLEVKHAAWLFGTIFIVVFTPLMFYVPTATNYIYSYVVPSPGTLYSERWHYQFIATGSIILLIFAPITLFALVSLPKLKVLRIVHFIVVVLLIVWYTAAFIVGCIDWSNANDPSSSNYYNKANDARWCCVYYMLPGSPCGLTDPCNPNYVASQLNTDAVFLMQLWYIFALILCLIIDLLMMIFYFQNGLRAYDDITEIEEDEENGKKLKDMEQALIQTRISTRPKLYRPKSTF